MITIDVSESDDSLVTIYDILKGGINMNYKKSIVLIAALFILSISSALAAPNFVLLYSNNNVSAYVDQESLSYDGTTIDSWLQLNIQGKSYVLNYLFNTDTKKMKAVKERVYDSNQKLVKEITVNQPWENIDPDNMPLYEKLLEKVKK